uniref:Uncharacterized protein n=1 Tax=Magallana gigas TaxID=29159 RepID=A0A8W8HLA6_MAGGI
MYNKPKSRLTLTKETNSTLSSLQILPALSSKHLTAGTGYNSQQIVERSVQPQEQVVFRPTQIPNNDIMMKRYPQGPPDFTLNHIAGRDRLMSHTHTNTQAVKGGCSQDKLSTNFSLEQHINCLVCLL